MSKQFKIFIASLVLSSVSWAGVSGTINQTAVTLQPGTYEARGNVDFILSRGGGVNFTGAFRVGLVEDMWDIEGLFGTGKTDFKVGANTKFNLLPDIPGQIGLAFLGGFIFINDDYRGADSDSIQVVNFATIASKKFEVDFGTINPYGGIQVEMVFTSGDNDFPISGILGSEWMINETSPFVYFSELDMDFNDSVWLLSAGGAYRF